MEEELELYVVFKDGRKDWVDPIVESAETDAEVIVHNGIYEYRFKKEELASWIIRPLEQDQ